MRRTPLFALHSLAGASFAQVVDALVPAAFGAVSPAWMVQARTSFSPAVK